MKKFSWLAICILLVTLAACSSGPEEADDEIVEDAQVEEEALATEEDDEVEEEVEEDFDIEAFLAEQEARVMDAMCDRPFQCFDEVEERDVPEGYTVEDCHAEYAMTGAEAEFLAEREVSELEACAEADEAATQCLQSMECDELLAMVTGELGPEADFSCAEEFAAQEQACAFFHEFAQEEE